MAILMTIIIAALGALIALVLLSAILQWLWNTTIPDIFGLKSVAFWQALKLLLIATILFGGPTSAAHVTSDGGSAAVGQDGGEMNDMMLERLQSSATPRGEPLAR